ncbi:hypothetical protein ANCDUO_14648 [Ancylostoma duodenale]|uniref:Uncharacterized protein n=1 Tax=Ancylostoma duodenale TaxID=51022 RepID=A0A0C2CZG0_9BILA|nr:hypothetical protein ANCDUO_14648 [Ancylostoma duodenale]
MLRGNVLFPGRNGKHQLKQDRGANSKVIIITPAMKQRLDFSCDEIPRKPTKQKLKAHSSRKSPQNREITKPKEEPTQQKQSTSGEAAKAGSEPAQVYHSLLFVDGNPEFSRNIPFLGENCRSTRARSTSTHLRNDVEIILSTSKTETKLYLKKSR